MNNINVLVVTHNSRLRKLLKTLGHADFTNPHRFKNCAILKLTFNKHVFQYKNVLDCQYTYSLELIYDGELGSDAKTKGKTYYDQKKFTKITNQKLPFDINSAFGSEINIFLVRHGEGIHNTFNWLNKGWANFKNTFNIQQPLKDALLTKDLSSGVQQAKNAAKKLHDSLLQLLQSYQLNNSTIEFVYASRLRRSFTTAALFIHIFTNLKSKITQDIKILPCAHELTGDNDNQIYESLENKSICTNLKTRETKQCDPNCLIEDNVNNCNVDTLITQYKLKLDWTLFDATFTKGKTEKNVCTTENMIQILIKDINFQKKDTCIIKHEQQK
jgi:broad specificity phosphatase PhoE